MRPDLRKLVPLAVAALLALLAIAGCGGGDDTTSAATGATESTESTESTETETETEGSVLGTPDKATGKPIVVGLLNLENGPVAFPQYREGAEAAASYVNEYKGGIQGRPIEIASCPTDGQPATSTRCANQIVEKDPLFILGGSDTGGSGSLPIYERAGLAYIGGMPLSPVESNAKDAAIFISIAGGDHAAAAQFAKETLGVKKVAMLNISDTQGKHTGEIIGQALEGAGIEADNISVSPTASDLSSPAAEAVSSGAELIYLQVPNSCAAMLKALESVGNTLPIIAVGACSSPQVIEAAGPAAEGVYFPEPFELLSSGSEDAEITTAAFDEYTSKEMPRENFAEAGFGSVMNAYEKLNEAPASDLEDPSKILGLFTAGSENPNWMAHPYTCNRKQVPGQEAVCNGYQQITQVKEGKVVAVTGWIDGAQNLAP